MYYESEREREKKALMLLFHLSLSLSLSVYLWQRTEKQRNMRNGPKRGFQNHRERERKDETESIQISFIRALFSRVHRDSSFGKDGGH